MKHKQRKKNQKVSHATYGFDPQSLAPVPKNMFLCPIKIGSYVLLFKKEEQSKEIRSFRKIRIFFQKVSHLWGRSLISNPRPSTTDSRLTILDLLSPIPEKMVF